MKGARIRGSALRRKSRAPGPRLSAASVQPGQPRSGRLRRRRFPRSQTARLLRRIAWSMAAQSLRGSKRVNSGERRSWNGSASRSWSLREDHPTTRMRRSSLNPVGSIAREVSGVTAVEAGNSRSRIDQPSCSSANPSAAMTSFLRSNAMPDRSHEPQAREEPAQESPVQVANFAGHIVLRMLWQLPRRALPCSGVAQSTGIALIQEPRSSESWLRPREQSRIGPARQGAKESGRNRRAWFPLDAARRTIPRGPSES